MIALKSHALQLLCPVKSQTISLSPTVQQAPCWVSDTELTETYSLLPWSLQSSGWAAQETLLTLVRERPWPKGTRASKPNQWLGRYPCFEFWRRRKNQPQDLVTRGQNHHGALSDHTCKGSIQVFWFDSSWVRLDIWILIISTGDSSQG